MRKVTLREVAAAAKVSTATASWAINHVKSSTARVSEETRQRVLKAAHDLGYKPNALAKGLSNGSSNLLGFITDDVATTPFAGQIIQGAQDEAWRRGRLLLVINTNGSKQVERQAFETLREQQVAGIVYSTWYHHGIKCPMELNELPSVMVDCYAVDKDFPAVVPDEYTGGYDATEILLSAGHRRIAFINTTSPSPARRDRYRGYRDALAVYGVAEDSSLIIDAHPNQEGGYASVDAILRSGVTGVFCHNDRVAMGLYDGLHMRGIEIPKQMSIVGFDNQEVISAHLHPALTSVGLPHYELGVRGIRTLVQQLETNQQVKVKQLVPCPVVKRDSVRQLGM